MAYSAHRVCSPSTNISLSPMAAVNLEHEWITAPENVESPLVTEQNCKSSCTFEYIEIVVVFAASACLSNVVEV